MSVVTALILGGALVSLGLSQCLERNICGTADQVKHLVAMLLAVMNSDDIKT